MARRPPIKMSSMGAQPAVVTRAAFSKQMAAAGAALATAAVALKGVRADDDDGALGINLHMGNDRKAVVLFDGAFIPFDNNEQSFDGTDYYTPFAKLRATNLKGTKVGWLYVWIDPAKVDLVEHIGNWQIKKTAGFPMLMKLALDNGDDLDIDSYFYYSYSTDSSVNEPGFIYEVHSYADVVGGSGKYANAAGKVHVLHSVSMELAPLPIGGTGFLPAQSKYGGVMIFDI